MYGFGTLDGSPWGSDETLNSKRVYPNGFNSMRFNSPEWDTEFAAALRESTQDAQAPSLQAVQRDLQRRAALHADLPARRLLDRQHKLKGPEKTTIMHPAGGGVHYWEWYIEA